MTNFPLLITEWYQRNKRDLPWRSTKNPYHIWLSEIILQQTRIDQGLSYYHRFIDHYPDIHHLANADEQEVLRDWQGLGYYSRARNLHFTARQISKERNGVFPGNYTELVKLKGVGPYTAAAIASFCFGEHRAVVDGNVYRVLGRFFDIELPFDSGPGNKHYASLAQSLLPQKDHSTYNQAIMEFGALQCTPANPNCIECPLNHQCLALANGTVTARPVKEGKTKIRKRYFDYYLFLQDGHVLLEKRTKKDIWQHLFQFPLIERSEVLSPKKSPAPIEGFQETHIFELPKHVLSHQHIFARIWLASSFPDEDIWQNKNWIKVPLNELEKFPLPQLLHRFVQNELENCV
ncbi:MAG: A/G-specific adenine glycosylase [Bacteroidetes bacterium]|nr:MAG: A/G-specific adenine glycosylase [Bacteroidota bacterium]